MKKKHTIMIILLIIVIIFISLWHLILDGYDKQNQIILSLKKIIPRNLAVKIQDTVFIIPELKTKNKLLETQVRKYEQDLQGQLFNTKKIVSQNKKSFILREFFLPFKQLDIKAGWNKLSNTFRAHYMEIVDNNVIIISGEGDTIYFEKKNIDNDKLNQKTIKNNIKQLAVENKFKFLGVRDILFDEDKIYISMLLENSNGFSMNIYVADYNLEYLDFKLFFEKNEYSKKYTIQTGGRLEKFKNNQILFSLGAADSLKNKVQDLNYLEGKIIAIDKISKKFKILSIGHRNPQGLLYLKKNNLIINTEHGPKGGDEVNFNFIQNNRKINNFGWPIASYGIEYDGTDPYKKSHQKYGFEEPFINYSPSIGISEILFLPKESNFINGNNLIVSSLRAASLYFIEISDDFKNIINKDRIFFSNQRIRDITYDKESKTIFIIFEITPSIGILKLN
jgi:hypothetical protein